MKSIRKFLVFSLIFSIGAVILLAILISYQRATHETEELYDAEIAQISRVLEAVLSIELKFSNGTLPEIIPSEQTILLPPDIISDGEFNSNGHKYEKKLSFQIWNRKGVPILGSKASGSLLPFKAQKGFATETVNQQAWRTFTMYSEKLSIWIKVGQLVEIRDEISKEIATVYSIIPLVMLPIVFVLITIIVRKGLSPLVSISKEISDRNSENLTPLNIEKIPKELNQVVASVNHLLVSLDRALERQKRFTGNAAHELRTPLAAIRVHAQNIYPEDERLQRVQSHIIQGVDKLTHLFNQLITLSRAETSQSSNQLIRVDLHDLLNSTIDSSLEKIIDCKAISLKIDVSEVPLIKTHPDALTVVLRNLIDNAVKYTQEGGSISITSLLTAKGVAIEIEDNGPGLEEDQLSHVFERFYRASDQSVDGCGLGLSIVYQLCDQLGHHVNLTRSTRNSTGLKAIISGIHIGV